MDKRRGAAASTAADSRHVVGCRCWLAEGYNGRTAEMPAFCLKKQGSDDGSHQTFRTLLSIGSDCFRKPRLDQR